MIYRSETPHWYLEIGMSQLKATLYKYVFRPMIASCVKKMFLDIKWIFFLVCTCFKKKIRIGHLVFAVGLLSAIITYSEICELE